MNGEQSFRIADTKRTVFFTDIDSPADDFDLDADWGKEQGATHVVRISNRFARPETTLALTSPFRFARVKKTVAYIAVSEEAGQVVWEKWQIRR